MCKKTKSTIKYASIISQWSWGGSRSLSFSSQNQNQNLKRQEKFNFCPVNAIIVSDNGRFCIHRHTMCMHMHTKLFHNNRFSSLVSKLTKMRRPGASLLLFCGLCMRLHLSWWSFHLAIIHNHETDCPLQRKDTCIPRNLSDRINTSL